MNDFCATSNVTNLAHAKQVLSIPELAVMRRWNWQPGRSCRCPYREDRNNSGSVMQDGKLFHDFATGETMDAPALLAKVEGLDSRTAAKLFIEQATIAWVGGTAPRSIPQTYPISIPWERPILPPLAPLNGRERRELAELRGLSVESIEMAHGRGLLWGLWWHGHRAWAFTDTERWNCQWRRLDGKHWKGLKGEQSFKSWGVSGVGNARPRAGWPVGITEAGKCQNIAFVEGGPDLLAALHFIHLSQGNGTAPVAILGTSRIDELALPLFTGKRVRLFCHADPASLEGCTKRPGMEAAARWQDQLLSVGCTVDTFDFSGLTRCDGGPVADLCDLAHLCEEEWNHERITLETLMIFK